MGKLEGRYITLTLVGKNLQLDLTSQGRAKIDEIKEEQILPNDHQILHQLLEDLIANGDMTWDYGNTVAMHGSFIIVGHGGPIRVHTEEDGDVADYWYDNNYAVRDIIVDLAYNYDSISKKMSMLSREPKPVILWLGPTDE